MTAPRTADGWRLFMVVGTQRTGTNLLREILNSSEKIVMVAEVMIPYADTCHWNHFAATLRPGSLPPPDEAAGLALLDRYFDYLHAEIQAKWNGPAKCGAFANGLDIKCDQLRLIEPACWPTAQGPFILHHARRRGTLLINTIRRNVIHCAISFLIGTQRDFWHNYEGRGFERAYTLDVGECLAYARLIVAQQRELEIFARGCSVVTCYYEDLAETVAAAGPGGDLSGHPGPLQGIASALGISCRFSFDGRLQRAINRPYSEVISNHRALVAALRSSEFAAFADTI